MAARALQHLVRDTLLPIAVTATISAVQAVPTPLDIVFSGTIILVVLQLDNLMGHTLLTDAQQLENAMQYSVVLTRQQEKMLQLELTAVFWFAWILLTGNYVDSVMHFDDRLEHPADRIVTDSPTFEAPLRVAISFIVATTIVSMVCRVWHNVVTKWIPCKDLVCRIFGDLCIRLIYFILSIVILTLFMALLYSYGHPVLRAATS